MTMFFHPTRSLIAIAITAATTPAIAHPDFQQTLFFGDSLTDSGYYRPLLPSNVQAITGKFTTNPGWVWAEHVASYYDSNASPNGNGQTGNNYAAGNARVNASSVNALGEAPPLISQTSTYLSANGGKADPNALYAIWGRQRSARRIRNPRPGTSHHRQCNRRRNQLSEHPEERRRTLHRRAVNP